MKSFGLLLAALLLAGCVAWRLAGQGGANSSPLGQGMGFEKFLVGLEAEAIALGLNAEPLRQSYHGQPPASIPALRKAENNQAEFTDTLPNYLSRAASPARVARGKTLLAEHHATLQNIERQRGVPASLMVALWGLESDFGRNAGSLPLLPSLISMAYQSPRHNMFRTEVLAALRLPQKTGTDVTTLKGSWAGATGQCQFMPSNVLKYAQDGNADGKTDIWHTPADVFASTANFIKALGYQPGQPWRWRVTKMPDMPDMELNERGLSEPQTQAAWAKRGLQSSVKVAPQTLLRLYKPENERVTYMVGANYEAVLGWNYSSYFATSVFTLADSIAQ